MIRLSLLCVVMLFSIGEGRFYRASPKQLKSQDATDIAPTSDYVDQSYTGFINYEGGEVNDNKDDAIEDASRIIRKRVAQGLRQHFGKLQSVLTAFADDDGFVREGIVFCGASEQEYDTITQERAAFTVNDTMPSNFHANGARLIEYDGWGVVVDEDHQEQYDKEQCGINNCQEGSVVAALANEIRSTGYQIQHRDICLADATTVDLKARSANLNVYKDSPAILCDDANGEVWFDILRDCIGVDPTLECGAGCKINSNDAENEDQMCWVDVTKHTPNCKEVSESTNSDKLDENIAGTAAVINAIRRVMRYSLNEDISAVQTTDYAYFTGCEDGGCTTLRNLFAALNGNAQISAFRDLGVEESIAYWETEIHSARTYLQGLADTFRSFRAITLELFPFIEEEEIEGCPMGEIEKTDEDSGSEQEPLCYQKSLDLKDLNKLSRDGQFISRSTCFCRNGNLDLTDGEATYKDIEKDDVYLSVEDGDVSEDDCNNMPTSARTFCKEVGSWGSRGPWRATLESLLPPSTNGRIKIYDEDPSTHYLKRKAITDNLVKTLPKKLDTSCGRIVSADHETSETSAKLLRSNKGGNCLPFAKLYEVIYRLEFETGEQGMGVYDCSVDGNTCPDEQTIVQSFCADKIETSELSFRQLAYKWDQADPKSSTRKVESSEFVGQAAADFGGGFLTYTGDTYVNSGGETVTRSFCLVDWLSEFGLNSIVDAGGHEYSDPFEAIKKYIDEAVFNTELAQSTKNKVITDNILIWKAIRKELTTAEDKNILDDIASAAARHFLYIMTTDEDDVMEQETFRASAQVQKEIREFNLKIAPVAAELPEIKEKLETLVSDPDISVPQVTEVITEAFHEIYELIQSLPGAEGLHRRRRLQERRGESEKSAAERDLEESKEALEKAEKVVQEEQVTAEDTADALKTKEAEEKDANDKYGSAQASLETAEATFVEKSVAYDYQLNSYKGDEDTYHAYQKAMDNNRFAGGGNTAYQSAYGYGPVRIKTDGTEQCADGYGLVRVGTCEQAEYGDPKDRPWENNYDYVEYACSESPKSFTGEANCTDAGYTWDKQPAIPTCPVIETQFSRPLKIVDITDPDFKFIGCYDKGGKMYDGCTFKEDTTIQKQCMSCRQFFLTTNKKNWAGVKQPDGDCDADGTCYGTLNCGYREYRSGYCSDTTYPNGEGQANCTDAGHTWTVTIPVAPVGSNASNMPDAIPTYSALNALRNAADKEKDREKALLDTATTQKTAAENAKSAANTNAVDTKAALDVAAKEMAKASAAKREAAYALEKAKTEVKKAQSRVEDNEYNVANEATNVAVAQKKLEELYGGATEDKKTIYKLVAEGLARQDQVLKLKKDFIVRKNSAPHKSVADLLDGFTTSFKGRAQRDDGLWNDTVIILTNLTTIVNDVNEMTDIQKVRAALDIFNSIYSKLDGFISTLDQSLLYAELDLSQALAIVDAANNNKNHIWAHDYVELEIVTERAVKFYEDLNVRVYPAAKQLDDYLAVEEDFTNKLEYEVANEKKAQKEEEDKAQKESRDPARLPTPRKDLLNEITKDEDKKALEAAAKTEAADLVAETTAKSKDFRKHLVKQTKTLLELAGKEDKVKAQEELKTFLTETTEYHRQLKELWTTKNKLEKDISAIDGIYKAYNIRSAAADDESSWSECKKCFENIIYTRSDDEHHAQAHSMAIEKLERTMMVIGVKHSEFVEARDATEKAETPANAAAFLSAESAYYLAEYEFLQDEKRLTKIEAWYLADSDARADLDIKEAKALEQARADLAAREKELASARTALQADRDNRTLVNNNYNTERTSNNPDADKLAEYTQQLQELTKEIDAEVARIEGELQDAAKETLEINMMSTWKSEYWDFIPDEKWNPISELIGLRKISCDNCASTESGKVGNYDSIDIEKGLTLPHYPRRYAEVKLDVGEDISAQVAEISLEVTEIVSLIDDLAKGDDTKEDIDKSKAFIGIKVSELWEAAKDFGAESEDLLTKFSTYTTNLNGYVEFWNNTDIPEGGKNNYDCVNTEKGKKWRSQQDFFDACDDTASQKFDVFAVDAELSDLNTTSKYLTDLSDKVDAQGSGTIVDTTLNNYLTTQVSNVEKFVAVCSAINDGRYSDKYDEYLATSAQCKAAFPFGDPKKCEEARGLIVKREEDNKAELKELMRQLKTLVETITALQKSISNHQSGASAIQSTAYIIERNAIVKNLKVFKEYALVGLPATGAVGDMDDDLAETRAVSRANIIAAFAEVNELSDYNQASPGVFEPLLAVHLTAANLTDKASKDVAIDYAVKAVETFNFLYDTQQANLGFVKSISVDLGAIVTKTEYSASGLENINFDSEKGAAKGIQFNTDKTRVVIDCLTGFGFNAETGTCEAALCDAGEYSRIAASGTRTCEKCPAGEYGNTAGVSAQHDAEEKCTACENGQYASEGSIECNKAWPGYYATKDKSEQEPCAAGTYSNAAGAAQETNTDTGCTLAEEGQFVQEEGASGPQKCAAGTYQAKRGQSECKQAAEGQYVPESGAFGYALCSSFEEGGQQKGNRYTAMRGQVTCQVCPEGEKITGDHIDCTSCSAGEYCDGTKTVTQCINDGDNPTIDHDNDPATPCAPRTCNCANGKPLTGEACSYDGTGTIPEECDSCDSKSGFYDKTGDGATVNGQQKYVCHVCSLPLVNVGADTTSACAIGNCKLGEGYPSTAPDMSQMGSADDDNGKFSAILCKPCKPGSYSDTDDTGQCSKIADGYGCSAAQGALADAGCQATEICPVGKYRKATANVDDADGSNLCSDIPAGQRCKTTANEASDLAGKGCYEVEDCPSGFYRTGGATNVCTKIPKGEECKELGNGLPYVNITKTSTQCAKVRGCERGHFRVENSAETICSEIGAGKECADETQSGNRASSQTQEKCTDTTECPKGYFRGYEYKGDKNEAEDAYEYTNTLQNTFCSQIPEGHFGSTGEPSGLTEPTTAGKDDTGSKSTFKCGNEGNYRANTGTEETERTNCHEIPLGKACSNWAAVFSGTETRTGPGCTGVTTCDPGSDGTGSYGPGKSSDCTSCRKCSTPGEGQTSACTASADTGCGRCEDETWGTNGECTGYWTECPAGNYVSAPASNTADRTCSPCEAGTFKADATAKDGVDTTNTCGLFKICGAGKFVKKAGTATSNSECDNCPNGWFNADTDNGRATTECALFKTCEAGKKVLTAGKATANSKCEACTSGLFNAVTDDGTKTTKCLNCAKGKIFVDTDSACTDCLAGKYNDVTSTTDAAGQCKDCGTGKYSSEEGNDAESKCKNCDAGKFSAAEGATSDETCSECAVGKSAGSAASKECAKCAVGTYQNTKQQTGCLPIEDGKECEQILSNTATTVTESTTGCSKQKNCPNTQGNNAFHKSGVNNLCTKVSIGHALSGTTGESECNSGEYQPLAGQSGCETSVAGSYAPAEICSDDSTDETACTGDNTWSNAVHTELKCAAGHISAAKATACTKCTWPQVANAAQTVCIDCSDTNNDGRGSYPKADQTTCLPVQDGKYKVADATTEAAFTTDKTCLCANNNPSTGTDCKVHGTEDCASCKAGYGRYLIQETAGTTSERHECVLCTDFSNVMTNHTNQNGANATTDICALATCPEGKGFSKPPTFGGQELTVEAFLTIISQQTSNMRGGYNPDKLDCNDCAENHFSPDDSYGQCQACARGEHTTSASGNTACAACDVANVATYAPAGEGCKVATCKALYTKNAASTACVENVCSLESYNLNDVPDTGGNIDWSCVAGGELASGDSCVTANFCKAGYTVSGERSCDKGSLTNTLKCTANDCTDISICGETRTISSGSSTASCCNAGHAEATAAKCEAGQFTYPTCAPIACDTKLTPDNTDGVTLSGSTGETDTFTCDEGYGAAEVGGDAYNAGDRTATCGADQAFSFTACAAEKCTATEAANSDKSTSGSITGNTDGSVAIECNAGYHAKVAGEDAYNAGDRTATCGTNNVFTITESCKAQKCVQGSDGTEDPPNQILCQNGGTASGNADACTCSCPAGFNGDKCENNIDDCDPNPCQNGGTCTDGVNSYTCACASGFGGTDCADACATVSSGTCTACTGTDVNECTAVTCASGRFDADGNVANGCEGECAREGPSECTACTGAEWSHCTAVTCSISATDTNGLATDGCEVCATGWADDASEGSCTVAAAGYVVNAVTNTGTVVPETVACPEKTFSTGGSAFTNKLTTTTLTCTAHTSACGNDKDGNARAEETSASATSDITCVACADGYFAASAGDNCTVHTTCGTDTGADEVGGATPSRTETAAGTATSDRTCSACTGDYYALDAGNCVIQITGDEDPTVSCSENAMCKSDHCHTSGANANTCGEAHTSGPDETPENNNNGDNNNNNNNNNNNGGDAPSQV